jgi:type I restriction enzyme R subunit
VVADPTGGDTVGEPHVKYHVAGKRVTVLAERVEYLDEHGKLVTESLRDYSKRELQKRFASLHAFLTTWQAAERKQAVIDELAEHGLLLDPLSQEVGTDLDPFDLICHIAFDQPPLTRRERAEQVRKRDVFTRFGPQARAVLEAILAKYQDVGPKDLDDPKILSLDPFRQMGTPVQLIKAFGGKDGFAKAVHDLQAALYPATA